MNTEPVHLLIVEDEAAHVEAIRRAFEAAGSRAEIRAVGTLREYREELAASPPDLALVDLNLADGRAVEILTHPPESAPFPILVMTAFGTEQIVVEVMMPARWITWSNPPKPLPACPKRRRAYSGNGGCFKNTGRRRRHWPRAKNATGRSLMVPPSRWR